MYILGAYWKWLLNILNFLLLQFSRKVSDIWNLDRSQQKVRIILILFFFMKVMTLFETWIGVKKW